LLKSQLLRLNQLPRKHPLLSQQPRRLPHRKLPLKRLPLRRLLLKRHLLRLNPLLRRHL